MKKILKSKLLLYFIILYQIAAGLFGLYIASQQSLNFIVSYPLHFIIIVGLFVFSIICGVKIWFNKVKGLKLSIINQYLQLIQFSILGFGFYYVAGIYLATGFSDTPNYHFLFDSSFFRSSCYITINSSDNEIAVLVNLVAVGLIILMDNLTPLYRDENKNLAQD